jgi:hypothetical protein
MDHISAHVMQLLQENNVQHYWKFLLMNKWDEIMGGLASKVTIQKMDESCIVLGVNDSSWMQELHLLSELIKEKINQTLGSSKIQTIKFRYASATKKPMQKKQKPISLTHQDRALTAYELQALEKINDQELAQALIGFLQRCHQFS